MFQLQRLALVLLDTLRNDVNFNSSASSLKKEASSQFLLDPFIETLYHQLDGTELPIEICHMIVSYIPELAIIESNLDMIETSLIYNGCVLPFAYYIGYFEMFLFCVVWFYCHFMHNDECLYYSDIVAFYASNMFNLLVILHLTMISLYILLSLWIMEKLNSLKFATQANDGIVPKQSQEQPTLQRIGKEMSRDEMTQKRNLVKKLKRCLLLETFRISNIHNHYQLNLSRLSNEKHNFCVNFYSCRHKLSNVWFKLMCLLLIVLFDICRNIDNLLKVAISIMILLCLHFIFSIALIAEGPDFFWGGKLVLKSIIWMLTHSKKNQNVMLLKNQTCVFDDAAVVQETTLATYCYTNIVPYSCFDGLIPCVLFIMTCNVVKYCLKLVWIESVSVWFGSIISVQVSRAASLIDIFVIIILLLVVLALLCFAVELYIFMFSFASKSDGNDYQQLLKLGKRKHEFKNLSYSKEYVNDTIKEWLQLFKRIEKGDKNYVIGLKSILNENQLILLQMWLYDEYYLFLYQLSLPKLVEFLILFDFENSVRKSIGYKYIESLKRLKRENEVRNERKRRQYSQQKRARSRKGGNVMQNGSEIIVTTVQTSALAKKKNSGKRNTWKIQNKNCNSGKQRNKQLNRQPRMRRKF